MIFSPMLDPWEGECDDDSDLEIGLYGRGKRNDNAIDLKIIHVHQAPCHFEASI